MRVTCVLSQVFILGGIGLVLGGLAVIFWTYFMYLWRSWDVNKRGLGDKQRGIEDEEFAAVVDGPEFFEYDGSDVSQALLESRRKSVTFAVCTPVKVMKLIMAANAMPTTLMFSIRRRKVPPIPIKCRSTSP